MIVFISREEPIDYGALEESIRKCAKKNNLEDVDGMFSWISNGDFPQINVKNSFKWFKSGKNRDADVD